MNNIPNPYAVNVVRAPHLSPLYFKWDALKAQFTIIPDLLNNKLVMNKLKEQLEVVSPSGEVVSTIALIRATDMVGTMGYLIAGITAAELIVLVPPTVDVQDLTTGATIGRGWTALDTNAFIDTAVTDSVTGAVKYYAMSSALDNIADLVAVEALGSGKIHYIAKV